MFSVEMLTLLAAAALLLATSVAATAPRPPSVEGRRGRGGAAFVRPHFRRHVAADADRSPSRVRLPRRQAAGHHDNIRPWLQKADGEGGGSSACSPGIVFPGGGLFFYWQAGVVAYLQERGYDLSTPLLSGASAGALSATLAKTGVSPYDATELALSMSEEAGVWDRPLGLQGVWGGIVRDWLDRLLPEDAVERAGEELHILLTPVPSFGKTRVSRFEDRGDLINANMASVHIPWFLDGNLTSNFRGRPYIDGSFLAPRAPSEYFSADGGHARSDRPTLVLDFKRDPVMRDRAAEFVKVVSKQAIWDILEQGRRHAGIMERDGEFDLLLPRK